MIIQKLPFQLFAASLLAVFVAAGCGPSSDDAGKLTDADKAKSGSAGKKSPVKLEFVTNGVSDFWKIAKAGIGAAEKADPALSVEFKQPPDGTPDQQRQIIEDALTNGVQGIAISVKIPKDQTQYLNDVAKKVPIVTQDSDAPDSARSCYIGTDNVAAGRQAGEEIKKALPNGGKIMLFVGNLDSANSKERKAGIEEAIKGTKITIVDTRTDDGIADRAKANVADMIVKNPDLACLVGIYSYNGPQILGALKDAGKLGKIKVVCFDEQAETIAGIKDGWVSATVVQQPFEFGKQACEMLAKLVRKEKADIPANKQIIVPTKVIDKSSVDEFKKNYDAMMQGS